MTTRPDLNLLAGRLESVATALADHANAGTLTPELFNSKLETLIATAVELRLIEWTLRLDGHVDAIEESVVELGDARQIRAVAAFFEQLGYTALPIRPRGYRSDNLRPPSNDLFPGGSTWPPGGGGAA